MNGITALADSYLTACRVEGKTPRTIDSYAESLGDFRRALDVRARPTLQPWRLVMSTSESRPLISLQ